jgi:hypothetical protein
MADVEAMLARRAEIEDEITQTIGRLGVLMRQEVELQEQLRRAAEADGSKTNPFSSFNSISDAVCAELTCAGLNPHRADQAIRLAELIDGQHTRYRAQRQTRAQVAGRPAA